ncbi:HAD family phosphatase [Acidimicrobiales bacterium]|jgi:putative hydrolase of the HAD superfamily|nr:HAD family phosphatase [Acidimicrobiales bacterium]
MVIEAVLFDYSGVLTTSLRMPTDDVPYDPDALFVEMAAALASTEPHRWHELERGEISLVDFCAWVEALVPGASSLFAMDGAHNVMANLSLIDDRLVLVGELKAQGLRTGLVTNNVAEWQPFWLPRLPMGLFEIVIDSAGVGHRKPEPGIYELAMQRLGIVEPSTVLFIDDFEWNVAGATDIGMVGLHCPADLDLRSALGAFVSLP